jgi:glutamyl-tRNA synthetase
MSVRTRFAPSPTGYLHIGGVRTAIFAWLFARRHGGQFILRIDDTDVERHREEALEPILHGFRWLGMQWHEGPEVGGPHAPYFQSQRLEKYRAAAARLLESGHAYPCFCTPEELAAERTAAEKARRPYRYGGRCRRLAAADRQRLHAEGRRSVTRFAVPPSRRLSFTDLILGAVAVETSDLGDFVIVRSDGMPLYNFASVVDDIDMQITHVIRAQEHLSNTWPQWLLFEALGAAPPAFAHVPYVAAPGSKEKLSKRNLEKYQTEDNKKKFRVLGWKEEDIPNPVMLSFYEELGYLPDAMLNGLARLGWSLDDKREKISRAELLEHFSLERVNAAPASFDPDKLYWLQGEYMRELPLDEKVAGVIPHLKKARLLADPIDAAGREKVRRVVEAIGDRLKLFSDVIPYGSFFFTAEVEYDPDAVKKTLHKDYLPALLPRLRQLLAEAEPFDAPTLEKRVREFAESEGLTASKVIHPLRVATSGRSVGPGLFELLAILGKDTCVQRIEQTIKMLERT